MRERVRQLAWLLKPQRAGRFLRRLMRLRRRAYRGARRKRPSVPAAGVQQEIQRVRRPQAEAP